MQIIDMDSENNGQEMCVLLYYIFLVVSAIFENRRRCRLTVEECTDGDFEGRRAACSSTMIIRLFWKQVNKLES